jgi:hypothetical protein
MGRHQVKDDVVVIRNDVEHSRIRQRWDSLALLTVLLIVIWLGMLTVLVVNTTAKIGETSEQQIKAVAKQNDLQICTQHDIIESVKAIGRKLGLPVSDIRPPDVEDLNCEALGAGS